MALWSLYAFIAMACFAGMQLLFKQLTRAGLSAPAILLFVFAVGALLFLVHVVFFRTPLHISTSAAISLVLAGVLGYVGNLWAVRAIGVAPNPGYALAIIGMQALVVTTAAIVLFDAGLTWPKALGVLLCFAGVALLVT